MDSAAVSGILLFGVLAFPGLLCADDPPELLREAATEPWFEQRIRPVLVDRCFRCHGGERVSGGLRVDALTSLLTGGESGPAIVSGDADASLLVRAIERAADVSAMPPAADAALSDQQVRDFRLWISAGAFWPKAAGVFVSERHWSFEPLAAAVIPDSTGSSWVKTPIDAFILQRMQAAGVVPAVAADRRTLLRRAAYDLTGLPPSAAEVEAFVRDERENAFALAVDRLLESPAYGEKWGRHWLDVVRYADTAGETADYPLPEAWRYRNYVIDAFNADLPYDEFVREQIAGDLLAEHQGGARFAERTTATGFLALSRRFGFDSENYHHLTIQDTIDTVGQTFLGLSLGCARCHDHKFDPVSMRDYYALYGIFASSRYPFPGSEQKPRVRVLTPLVSAGESAAAWQAYVLRTESLAARLRELGQAVPSAVLRLATDVDGDFELQAPAAGGSYGVPVPPWCYTGGVSITTDAQSPFRNVYPGGRCGVSVPAGAGAYRLWQVLHSELAPSSAATNRNLNLDLRVGGGDGMTGEHRLRLSGVGGVDCCELVLGGGLVQLVGAAGLQRVGGYVAGEWFNLQLSVEPGTGRISGRVGVPERLEEFALDGRPWTEFPVQIEVYAEGGGSVSRPSLELDQFAFGSSEFARVSREFLLPQAVRDGGPESAASLERSLWELTGIDGDLELQAAGGGLAAPWNAGPGSVVRLRAESQSPHRNVYGPGNQGLYLPSRGEYDGFGVTLRELPGGGRGRLHLAFDFRVSALSEEGGGSWRYYLGHGPGSSAAVELFFNSRRLFCRSGTEFRAIAEVGAEAWHQLQLSLDIGSRRYVGRLLRGDEEQQFEGEFSAGWDGVMDYSFVDSYGHIGGLRPALDFDNYVFRPDPVLPLATVAEDGPSVASRRAAVEDLQRRLRAVRGDAEQLGRELARLLAEGPEGVPLAYAMSEGTPQDVCLQQRGEPTQPGPTVARGFITVLGDAVPGSLRGSGRAELAEWLLGAGRSLTARVMVNRIWQQHFGRGLVGTPNDFGVRGLPPTHPELLDWLAQRFIEGGWSIKAMHRLMLGSAVWQQACLSDEAVGEDLFRGFARRRLTAEEIRDSILAVSGELDDRRGTGHPFPDPSGWGFSQHAPFSGLYDHRRRSVYLMQPRLRRHPYLALFDGADPNASTAARPGTTVPTQALFFLNDPLVHESAGRWAEALLREAGEGAGADADLARIRRAWQGALQRAPAAEELGGAREFLNAYRQRYRESGAGGDVERESFAALLRVLIGGNEFLYVD
ncbi:MAG: hypothetical protein RL215_832 [Planctomycetota bacterium]